MNKFTLLCSVILCLTLSGCGIAGAGQVPVPGLLYSEYKAPAYDLTTETSAAAAAKMGRATCKSILGLVALGDCSLEAAKKAGGISRVAAVDYEYENIIGVYATYTLRVSGQ